MGLYVLIFFFSFSLQIIINKAREETWQPGVHTEIPLHRLKRLLGTKLDPEVDLPQITHDLALINSLPESFDAREKWPMCPSLKEIRDQGVCGSCWALGAVEAMTDRYCIFSNGTKKFHFSAEDLLTCGPGDCESGGSIIEAWQYWIDKGIVSGGNYNSGEGCRPYSISEMEFDNGKLNFSEDLTTPPCNKACRDGYNVTYEDDKRYGNNSYAVKGMKNMMAELYKNGPFEVGYVVYGDFMKYKNGDIYEHVSGGFLGRHAVKVVGWGVEKGKQYWLIANSWGTEWGMGGYFKIRRGNNECEIEEYGVGGEPKI